ncbi:ParA family protein, partial [Bacillus velezensis]|uniref:ParA family protein n=1 Tax=Bacillus velezensis TaxID=492670 RepID=UPI002FFED41C
LYFIKKFGGEKMAKIITFGIQKGGSSKTTTSGIVSYLLAQEGYKVLAVDMDSQGNLTDLLTQRDITYFEGKTILDAFQTGNVNDYIYKVNENLSVLPSDDYLATLSQFLYGTYSKKGGKIPFLLKESLESIKDDYDFIIIDTPPSLSEPMINSLCASDYVVVLCESSKWAFTAIERFLETIVHAQMNYNSDLKVVGVLRNLIDSRRTDSQAIAELIAEKYPDIVFPQIIKRRAQTGRISLNGLYDNPEIKGALVEYLPFYEELKKRVNI